MNLKSRIFGFAAAAMLSLGIVSGVSADTSAPVQGVFNAAQCSISITNAPLNSAPFSFGTWTWNTGGNTYYGGNGGATINYSVTKFKSPSAPCSYTVGLAGPLTGAIPANTIATSSFSWNTSALTGVVPLSVTGTGAGQTGTFTVNETALPTITADTYSGTLDFTVVTGI